MLEEIVTLDYSKAFVGKYIKKSKERHCWRAIIDSIDLAIELFLSKYSKKVRIKVNSIIVLYTRRDKTPFRYSFMFRAHKIAIAELPTEYELTINDRSFDYFHEKNGLKLKRSQTHKNSLFEDLEGSPGQNIPLVDLAPKKSLQAYQDLSVNYKLANSHKEDPIHSNLLCSSQSSTPQLFRYYR